MSFVRTLRAYLFSFASSTRTPFQVGDSRWDLTLLGGLLASLFSLCQFLVSPHIGRLSDTHGRRAVLLSTMLGNLASAALWLFAGSFEVYALSRVVGGLSEGNVQLSIACISDVTSPEERARSLALVGAAFSLAFTVGPSVGAYLSQRAFAPGGVVQLPFWNREMRVNAYAVPAAMTLVLLLVETVYLWACLPESRGWQTGDNATAGADEPPSSAPSRDPSSPETPPSTIPPSLADPSARLSTLSTTHLLFLFCFSGAEFTLTFLTHALFRFSNASNGRLLGFVGLVSAALSGGYVRRLRGTGSGSARLAQRGMWACAAAMGLLALLPALAEREGARAQGATSVVAKAALWSAAALLAFVSATVVTSLSALASSAASSSSPSSSSSSPGGTPRGGSGAALGAFRSAGQLGRALGPLVFTAVYWTCGPAVAYAAGAVGVVGVAGRMGRVRREEERREGVKVGGKGE